MSTIVDDTRDVTVSLVGYPLLVITGVDVPAEAAAGAIFNLVLSVRNDGEDGIAYFVITDLDTGAVVVPKTEWIMYAGWAGDLVESLTMPNKTWHLHIEVGHIGVVGESIIDSSRDFTVGLPVALPPLDLPMIGGIALAVADAALLLYAVATHISR